jgi:hypothetical protein
VQGPVAVQVGGRSRIAMIVCITRSPTSAIYFLIRKQQPAVRQIATGMLALTVAELPLGHHADERLTAIHPFAVRSLPKPVR